MLIEIQTQGTGAKFLPALVVGFDLAGIKVRQGDTPFPEWFVALSPQVGGYAMSYPQLLGAVLRLDANEARGRAPLGPLIRGLRAMGEDPDYPLIDQEFPALRPLVGTSGHPYSAEELKTLHALVGRCLDLPAFDQGIEALARFGECDALKLLADWTVMRARLVAGRRHPFTSEPPPYIVEESNTSDLVVTDDVPYRSIHEELRAIGRHPPRVWLLWENSD